MAGELVEIFSAVQIIAPMFERISALAVHKPRSTRRVASKPRCFLRACNCFADMAKVAIALGDSARQALVESDLQEAAQPCMIA